jgi:dimethylaniline monooxygenase (N-oxide forming)
VYISHRRGIIVTSRDRAGPPPELTVNWQTTRLIRWIEQNYPKAYGWLIDLLLRANERKSWEFDPAWGLNTNVPSSLCVLPCMNDDLVPLLAQKRLHSVHGIKRFVGPKSIELLDGTVLEDIDAVVMATGYDFDLKIAPWIKNVPPKSEYGGAGEPELYLQMIPPQYADSAWVLSVFATLDTIWVLGELASMAMAQLWTGKAQFPSQAIMHESIRKQVEYNALLWRTDHSTERGIMRPLEWAAFVHEKAGTGLFESLGWGWAGWKFWWQNRDLSRLMGWGILSPFNNRLLETGKRKAWDGAAEALRKITAEAKGLDAPFRKLTLENARAGRL